MVLFGMEPERVALGFELSVGVRNNFDKLIETVLEELRSMGALTETLEAVPQTGSFWENAGL
jgi:hypothetical protein